MATTRVQTTTTVLMEIIAIEPRERDKVDIAAARRVMEFHLEMAAASDQSTDDLR
ncbi:hypothetical protein [Ferroacidibacillus organovorans]|uniref:hypothetical protein n=1 Tax=Ferroacidibacillus organovorans TaxID=1765683 RepID=UPI0012E97319|nr:hypothetical protein [Ferroacidibacillus organovorans]